MAYLRLGRYEESERLLRHAMSQEPYQPEPHRSLAELYLAQRQTENALSELREWSRLVDPITGLDELQNDKTFKALSDTPEFERLLQNLRGRRGKLKTWSDDPRQGIRASPSGTK
jgi:hypothetical protein